MHHALQIQEILLNIFSNFYVVSSPLLALARTCHAFKEPALDILWSRLTSLCALAWCLPEAFSGSNYPIEPYQLRRPLTSAEWDVLRNYTSRTRSLHLVELGLSRRTLISLQHPTTEPLFPNVRSLCVEYTPDTEPLIFWPFPSLISLDIDLQTTRFVENFLGSLAKTSPNLTTLSIFPYEDDYVDMKRIEPSFICRWQNLQIVKCHEISLDTRSLLHLSHMPSLTHLDFTLDDTLPDQFSPSDLPLIFPTLPEFVAASESLDTVSRFISQARLPAVNSVSVITESQPSQETLSTFFSTLQTSSSVHNVREMLFEGRRYRFTYRGTELGFQGLAPCMAFSHLGLVRFDFKWAVSLTDEELLTLASSWPQLEELSINMVHGWEGRGGITPDGVLRLLQTCPSLSRFALAIDTRGYTAIPPSPESLGLAVRQVSSVDVVDSDIESGSVPAIAAFLSGVVVSADFSFRAWDERMGYHARRDMCLERWEDVEKQCREMVAGSQSLGTRVE